MGKIVIPSPVYPDIDSLDFKEVIRKLGIEDIQFLLDDGVQITYSTDIEPLDVKKDSAVFYDCKTKAPVVKYVANFDYIEFYRGNEPTPFIKLRVFEI